MVKMKFKQTGKVIEVHPVDADEIDRLQPGEYVRLGMVSVEREQEASGEVPEIPKESPKAKVSAPPEPVPEPPEPEEEPEVKPSRRTKK